MKRTDRKSIDQAQNIGDPNDIRKYRRGRKCRLCKQQLTIYTPGPYCLVHEHRGALIEMEKEERAVARRQLSYRKKMSAKEKKKAYDRARNKILNKRMKGEL